MADPKKALEAWKQNYSASTARIDEEKERETATPQAKEALETWKRNYAITPESSPRRTSVDRDSAVRRSYADRDQEQYEIEAGLNSGSVRLETAQRAMELLEEQLKGSGSELDRLYSAYEDNPTGFDYNAYDKLLSTHNANVDAYNQHIQTFGDELDRYNSYVERYNHYNSAAGMLERMDALLNQRDKARAEMLWQQKLYEEENVDNTLEMEKASADYERYSQAYDELLNNYYYAENQEKLASLQGDTVMSGHYNDAKSLQEDIDKIAAVMAYYSPSSTGDPLQVEEYKAYLAEKYGLDQRAIDEYAMSGARTGYAPRTDGGYSNIYELYEELMQNKSEATDALAGADYDYERMTGYEQMLADKAAYAAKQQEWAAYAKERPFWSSVDTILMAPLQGVDYLKTMAGGIGTSNTRDPERYVPMNVYNMDITNFVSTVRGTVAKDIEANTDWEIFGQNVWSFLYQTGMSVGDSALQVAAFGTAATYFMGLAAASNQAKNVLERGGTNSQAFWGGLAAGAAEAIFEKFSVESLLKIKNVTGWRSVLESTVKQMGVEANEEAFTEIANILADAAIMGNKSEFSIAMQEYMAGGMSEEEAYKQAFLDAVGQVGWAAAGGALSGGVTGGFQSTASAFVNGFDEKTAGSKLRGMAEDVANAVDASGLEPVSPGSEVHNAAQEVVAAEAERQETMQQTAQEAWNQAATKAFGETGAKAFQTVNDGNIDSEALYAGFAVYHHAGMTGRDMNSITSQYAKNLPDDLRKIAYDAGVQDAAASVNARGNAAQTIYGTDAGVIANDYSKGMNKKLIRAVDEVAKSVGRKVIFEDLGSEDNGYLDDNGVIHIDIHAEDPELVVFAHEITHVMEDLAPVEHKRYRDYVLNKLADAYGGSVLELVEEHKRKNAAQNLSDERTMNELVADYTKRMMKERNLFAEFAQKDRTAAQKLVDAVKRFLQKMKDFFKGNSQAQNEAAQREYDMSIDMVEQAVKLWDEALTASQAYAQKAIQNQAANKNTAQQDGGNVRASAKRSQPGYNAFRTLYAKEGLDDLSRKLGDLFPLSANFETAISNDNTPLSNVTITARSTARNAGENFFAAARRAVVNNYPKGTQITVKQIGVDAGIDMHFADESIAKASHASEKQTILDIIPYVKDLLPGSRLLAVERVRHTDNKKTALFCYRLYNAYKRTELDLSGNVVTRQHAVVFTVIQNLSDAGAYLVTDIKSIAPDKGRIATNSKSLRTKGGALVSTIADLYDIVKRIPRNDGGLLYSKSEDLDYKFDYTETNDGKRYSRKGGSVFDEADSVEELQRQLNELNTEYRTLEAKDREYKGDPEYKALMDAISEAHATKKSLFDKPAALEKALADYTAWQNESGYTEVYRRMEELRGEMKTLNGKLDQAKEEAKKKAKAAYRATFDEEMAKKYASKAARKFGTTSRFDLAGYLTVNGSLLDFSARRGYRVRDHREISEVLDFLPEDHGYSDGLIEFMNLGNIRMQSYGIDISKAPNKAQIPVLRRFFNSLDGEVTVDFSRENGDSAGSIDYPEGTKADRILSDISTYFKTGEVPEQSLAAQFHYSKKGDSVIDAAAARAEDVDALKRQVEHWKSQVKQTKGFKVNAKDVERLAKQLMRTYKVDTDTNVLTKMLQDLYDGIATGYYGNKEIDYETAQARSAEIAKILVEDAVETENEMYVEYAELRKYLRSTTLNISPEDSHDIPDFNDFRKRNFGRMRIGSNGTNIDTVYKELSTLWPEFFNEENETTPSDQLLRIAEVMEGVYRTQEVNPFGRYAEEAVSDIADEVLAYFFTLPQAQTFADKAAARLKQATADATLAGQMAQGRRDAALLRRSEELAARAQQRAADALAKEKQRGAEAMQKLKDNQAAKTAKTREQRKAAELRGKIIRHSRDMNQKLLRPTDKKHVPEELQSAVAAVLQAINLESNRDTADQVTNRTKAFQQLREAYKKLAGEVVIDPAVISGDGDQAAAGPLLQAVLDMGDIRIADMNSSQLDTVWRVLKAMEQSVRKANKLFLSAKYETISEMASQLQSDSVFRKPKKAVKAPKFLGGSGNLTLDLEIPLTFFSQYGEVGAAMYKELRDAQDYQERLIDQLADQVGKIVTPKQVQEMQKEVHTFKTEDGDELKLTTAHIMEMYELSKRKQAEDHLLKGGIVQPEIQRAKVDRGTDMIKLTATDIGEIISKLNKEQKQIADALQGLLTTTLADAGNRASMQAYGYKKFTGTDYWPIKSAQEALHHKVEKGANNTRSIKNIGLAQQVVPHANTALNLSGIFQTFAGHATDMIDYAAWLCPMEDANRLFNYKYKDANGIPTGKTVKGILDKVGGSGSQAYWSNLMEDIQNGIGGPGDSAFAGIAARITGNVKGASVGANIRVVVQQPTAIFRAAAILSPANLSKGLARGVTKGNGWKKALEHSDIAKRKDRGGFEISNQMQMSEILFDDRTHLARFSDKMSWAAAKADAITWGKIWNACEWQVHVQNKALKPGSNEFYRQTAELFADVINQSQVVDGVLQRSQIMRSSNQISKQMTSFMGEPTMALNMLMRAYDTLRYEQNPPKRGKAMKQAARVAAALLVADIVTALAQSLVDGLRDDDREKMYWQRVLSAFTGVTGDEESAWDKAVGAVLSGNLGSTMNPVGRLPYAKDLLSLIQGYSVERMDISAFSDLISAGTTFIDSLSGEGTKTWAYATKQLATAGSKVLGISASNILRDVWSIARSIAIETGNLRLQYEMEKAIYKISNDKNDSRYIGILYDAMKNDREAYEMIYADMVKNGVAEDKIAQGIEKRMKADQGVTSVADLSSRYLTPNQEKEYDKAYSRVTGTQVWKSATEEQREKLEGNLYDLTVGNGAGEDLREKIEPGRDVGIDEVEYLLYKLAQEVVSEDGNKNTSQAEAEAAAEMLTGLSKDEQAWLWQSTNKSWKSKNNPFN